MRRWSAGLLFSALGVASLLAAWLHYQDGHAAVADFAPAIAIYAPEGVTPSVRTPLGDGSGDGTDGKDVQDPAPTTGPLDPDARLIAFTSVSGLAVVAGLDAGPFAGFILPEDGPIPILYAPHEPTVAVFDHPLALFPGSAAFAVAGLALLSGGLPALLMATHSKGDRARLRLRLRRPGAGAGAGRRDAQGPVRTTGQGILTGDRTPSWPRASMPGRSVDRETAVDPGARILLGLAGLAVALALVLLAL